MEVIPWKSEKVPGADYVGGELRKIGYVVSAHPFPVNHQSVTHNTLNGEEILWMVKGKIDLNIDQKKYTLNAGDRILIPKGLKYHFRVNSPEGAFYLLGKK